MVIVLVFLVYDSMDHYRTEIFQYSRDTVFMTTGRIKGGLSFKALIQAKNISVKYTHYPR